MILTNIVSHAAVYINLQKLKAHFRQFKIGFGKSTLKIPLYLKKFALNLKK
jgi:hypothetical protein